MVKKTLKILLSIVIALIVLTAATIGVLRFAFGIDVFDRSGWTETRNGRLQYCLYDGTPLEGWQTIDGDTYYFDPAENATMVTGWLEYGVHRYYLGCSGVVTTGWSEIDGAQYFFDNSGAMMTGWLEQDGQTYYLGDSGAKVTGWFETADGRYYSDENGIKSSCWLELDDGLYCLDKAGHPQTGWLEAEAGRRFFDESGKLYIGWLQAEEGCYYLSESGLMVTGWLDLDGKRYHFDESGLMTTGWYETEDGRYYFYEDGVMAIGRVEIDGVARHFASNGKYVVLVNFWNPVPDDYVSDLVEFRWGFLVDAGCRDAMEAMIAACNAAGYYCGVNSVYRSYEFQNSIWSGQVERYIERGYSREEAENITNQSIAVPGTSEHQLGLAVDVACGSDAYAWLAAHSWEYGFILRYPYGKTELTGILYEPWHFRYVGVELAFELYELGLCMEEYMDMLTERAGN